LCFDFIKGSVAAMPTKTHGELVSLLREAEIASANWNAMIGLDGFVDTILRVVDRRESPKKYTPLDGISEFAARIGAAAGQSANFELVVQLLKLGGNGPIMANALASAGLGINYIGALGTPSLHPAFEDFARRVTVYSFANPGLTDAVEFDDGKLMLGKLETLNGVTWEALTRAVPAAKLAKLLGGARLLALVNWTMLPHMGAIMDRLLTEIGPKLKGDRRWAFFDLADPAKRTPRDIAAALKLIARYERHFRVILGLNFSESRQIGRILGLAEPEEKGQAVADHAARIREKLEIDTVVIHPVRFAAAADASGQTFNDGPYVPKPKITTGAGDHFNAGFCLGRLAGGDIRLALQTGVGTSGFYVRTAKSPAIKDLIRFAKMIPR
jgi:sugar/nucleoside kinase (ribokinase family)